MKRILLALIGCALFPAAAEAQRRSFRLDGIQVFLDIPAVYKFEKREKSDGKDEVTFRASSGPAVFTLLNLDAGGGFKPQTAKWRAEFSQVIRAFPSTILVLVGEGPNYWFAGLCDSTMGTCGYQFEQLRIDQQVRLSGTILCVQCDMPQMKAAGALVQRLAKQVE